MTLRGLSEMTAEGRYFASLYNNTVVCLSVKFTRNKVDVYLRMRVDVT